MIGSPDWRKLAINLVTLLSKSGLLRPAQDSESARNDSWTSITRRADLGDLVTVRGADASRAICSYNSSVGSGTPGHIVFSTGRIWSLPVPCWARGGRVRAPARPGSSVFHSVSLLDLAQPVRDVQRKDRGPWRVLDSGRAKREPYHVGTPHLKSRTSTVCKMQPPLEGVYCFSAKSSRRFNNYEAIFDPPFFCLVVRDTAVCTLR